MNHHFFTALAVCLFALPALARDSAEQEAVQLFQKAQELAKAMKFDEAITAMKKAIALVPKNDLFLATTSDLEMKAGKYADGVEHALQAIKLNDKVGPYYILVAANALSDQDLDKAREYCETVLKRGKEFGPGACNDAQSLLSQISKKSYTLTWELDPSRGIAAGGTLAIALPKNNLAFQTVTYEVTGVKSQRLVKGDVNDVLYVVPQGRTPFTLITKVTVHPYSFKEKLARPAVGMLPAEARAQLGASYSIDPKSPALKKLAASLKGSDNIATVRNILAWMKKNVEYKQEKKFIEELDFKVVDEIVERGHAECRGYAMLFTALCRAADIPARPIWGIAIVPPAPGKTYSTIASHNWSEFYVAGCGWVPVDPQRIESLGCMPTYCMRMFMDAKKTKTSGETLPVFNLLNMNADRLKIEETR